MGIIEDLLGKIDQNKRAMSKTFVDIVRNPRASLEQLQGNIQDIGRGKTAKDVGKNLDKSDPKLIETLMDAVNPIAGVAGMLIPAARTKTMKELKNFIELEKKGLSEEEIYKQTGIYRGPIDGELKTHLSDKNAKINIDALKDNQFNSEIKHIRRPMKEENKTFLTLKDVLDHPELYKAMPELARIKVVDDIFGTGGGSYNRDGNLMRISGTRDLADMLQTIIHETQHGVQYEGNFTKGGNTKLFVPDPGQWMDATQRLQNTWDEKRKIVQEKFPDFNPFKRYNEQPSNIVESEEYNSFLKVEDLKKKASEVNSELHEKYMRLGGEAEARAVEKMLKHEKVQELDSPPIPLERMDTDYIVKVLRV